MANQFQQYTFFDQMRRRSLYREAMKAHNLNVIKQFIAAGGDPRKNPEMSAEYYFLVGEYGEGVFESEILARWLREEDDTKKDRGISAEVDV